MRLLPADPVRRGRAKLLLLAAACALPVAAGWLAYAFDWAPGATSNYGTLVAPRALEGAPFERLRGKWVIVMFDRAACDAYCEKKLYFMRQARKAQGRDYARVERLWLVTDDGRPGARLLEAIEGTERAPAGTLARQFGAEGMPEDHLYLVDPLGNLMLRWPREPDPARMIRDLQRLLKYSRVG